MEELWKLESVELSESRQFISRLSDRLKTTRDPGLLGELVEFYFKNGSKRARKVLTSLREAHSQVHFSHTHHPHTHTHRYTSHTHSTHTHTHTIIWPQAIHAWGASIHTLWWCIHYWCRDRCVSLSPFLLQDYFDKLHESIQKTSTRLPVLKLLAHTLNSEVTLILYTVQYSIDCIALFSTLQTSWLYRIVDHPLFPAILEQLKVRPWHVITAVCSQSHGHYTLLLIWVLICLSIYDLLKPLCSNYT